MPSALLTLDSHGYCLLKSAGNQLIAGTQTRACCGILQHAVQLSDVQCLVRQCGSWSLHCVRCLLTLAHNVCQTAYQWCLPMVCAPGFSCKSPANSLLPAASIQDAGKERSFRETES